MAYKVLTDGNGSGLIRVIGLGDYMPLKDHQRMVAECEHKSKLLTETMNERDALKASVKEAAYDAFREASGNNRADRWADNFDESVRRQFEKYWQENHKAGA